jgi:uncharacterized protein YukE
MNGTQLSEGLQAIEDAGNLLFRDVGEFCTLAYNNLELAIAVNVRDYGKVTNIYAQAQILESKIKEGEYDDEAVQIARKFLNEERFFFLIELDKQKRRCRRKVKREIRKYAWSATTLKLIQLILNLVVIIGAASVPFILSVPSSPRELATYISFLVAVSAAIIKLYKFEKQIGFYRTAALDMQQEYAKYTDQRDIYGQLSQGEALDRFKDKIDELRQKTHELSLTLSKSSEDQVLEQALRMSRAIPEIHHIKEG